MYLTENVNIREKEEKDTRDAKIPSNEKMLKEPEF